jgi:ABC-2 type transport system ATP-binding protein
MEIAPEDCQAAITAIGLVKHFGDTVAVDHIDLTVGNGEIFGILGPNGAGKTTLIEILEGLQVPDEGNTNIFGHSLRGNSRAIKQIIGAQLQASSYFDYLNLTELLELFGGIYARCSPPSDLLNQVGLIDKARARVRSLSTGQKQRFTIATALVNSPSILFLDEPTSGLDPQARHNIWDLVRRINSENRTVVLTTHMMEEAEELCHRVAIMDDGKIIAMGTPSNLTKSSVEAYQINIRASSDFDISNVASQRLIVHEGFSYSIWVSDVSKAIHSIQHHANQQQIDIEITGVRPQSLEEVFLHLTGKELRD